MKRPRQPSPLPFDGERETPLATPSAPHLEIGRAGEDLACRYLWRHGFRILLRNYAVPQGEIDIVAEKAGRIHFIEVKTRASSTLGEPEERVDRERRERLRDAAQTYLADFRDGPPAGSQFDVLAIVVDARRRPVRQNLIENAF